ncbi:MAG TPA: hypothetical protein VEF89_24380 [Solirubrobacteraceae bacterium]|nr:hypothetical protein [Solirubrobacteraceae bacterium]
MAAGALPPLSAWSTTSCASSFSSRGRGTQFDAVLLDHFLEDPVEAGTGVEPHGDRDQ